MIRIILKAEIGDLRRNLLCKKNLDSGDPKNDEEVNRRLMAYNNAIELVRSLDIRDGGHSEWVIINIRHVDNCLTSYMSNIIRQQVLPHISL